MKTRQELIYLIERECKPDLKTLKIHNQRTKGLSIRFPNEYKQIIEITSFVELGFNESYRVLKKGWDEYPKCSNPECEKKVVRVRNTVCNSKKCIQYQMKQTISEKPNDYMYDIIEKRKKTMNIKYGVDYALQSDKIKETLQSNNLLKYGVKNVSQLDSIKIKKEETCLRNFGVKYYKQSEELKTKSETTCLLKYGYKNPMQSDKIKNKLSKTIQHKYNCNWFVQSKNFRSQMEENNKWVTTLNQTDFETYKLLVWKETRKQNIQSLVDFEKRGRTNYHLDHCFSIMEGFNKCIPPYIIGGIKNLKFIPYFQNISKGSKCSLLIDQII